MNSLEFESYLLAPHRIPDDALRQAVLNVLATMEAQLRQGSSEAMLCVQARRDPRTEDHLDPPQLTLTFIDGKTLREDPPRAFKLMKAYADQSHAEFAIFAVAVTMVTSLPPDSIYLFVQHETMVEDHWCVAATIFRYESLVDLVNLDFWKTPLAATGRPSPPLMRRVTVN